MKFVSKGERKRLGGNDTTFLQIRYFLRHIKIITLWTYYFLTSWEPYNNSVVLFNFF